MNGNQFKKNKHEEDLLDLQIITTVLFMASLIISIFLTYNDKLCLNKQKDLFSKKGASNLATFNRIYALVLTLTFLYINYENRKIAGAKKQNLEPFNLQITASQLTTLAAIISLYVVLTSGEYNIVPVIENPIV